MAYYCQYAPQLPQFYPTNGYNHEDQSNLPSKVVYRDKKKELVDTMFDIGIFKEFVSKKNIIDSPSVSIDFRPLTSHPFLLIKIVEQCIEEFSTVFHNIDVLCSLPASSSNLPLATILSGALNMPMVMHHKKMKNQLAGRFHSGDRVLVIEDIINCGQKILETTSVLSDNNMNILSVFVLMDTNQGAYSVLKKNNLDLYSLFSLEICLETLALSNRIKPEKVTKIIDSITAKKTNENRKLNNNKNWDITKVPFEQREKCTTNILGKKLLSLMVQKESNLCVSVDVDQSKELLRIANIIGPHIVVIKTHIDLLIDFSPDVVVSLQKLAKQHNFLILEDRKFADIAHTTAEQYSKGLYRIINWADLVTVDVLCGGSDIMTSIEKRVNAVGGEKGIILLAQMNSKDNLISKEYTQKVIKLSNEHPFVTGVISLGALTSDAVGLMDILHFTPGIRRMKNNMTPVEEYVTPEEAVMNGSDVLIVGRSITESKDVLGETKLYQQEGWNAYKIRINTHNK